MQLVIVYVQISHASVMAQKPPLSPDFIPVHILFWGALKENKHTQRKWNTKRRAMLEKFISQNLQES